MCGYDPFYWYEYMLDQQYLERCGIDEGTETNDVEGTNDVVLRNTRNSRPQAKNENKRRNK